MASLLDNLLGWKEFHKLRSLKNLQQLLAIKRIILNNLRFENFTLLENFLCNLSWRKVSSLSLKFNNSLLLNKRKCFQSILNACYKVTFKVAICRITISQSSFMKLFSACRNTEKLIFLSCNISIPKVPDFGHSLDGSIGSGHCGYDCDCLTPSMIKRLKLGDCRINWLKIKGEYLDVLSKLVEGLSKSQDFRETLEEFGGCYSFNDQQKTMKIFRAYGFKLTHVRIG
ncbi:unnamed protein product [Moneuplotes crassus]|uniref:Uncharacterized protein n=1 Tax=Euplotes crassus TaxID=5936 RepID=A0AAD1UKS6_EUPCR|nr:unnamed protein product [Moneuplotes crassus]